MIERSWSSYLLLVVLAIDYSPDAVFQHDNVEINQQTDGAIGEAQVRQKLHLVDGGQRFYRLQFEDHALVDIMSA